MENARHARIDAPWRSTSELQSWAWTILQIVKRVQVALEADLLAQADEAARRAGTNRSALIRDALREHLRRLHIVGLEEQHRLGYERTPDSESDLTGWEAAATWGE
ncbi:MAG: CopG family transcriptional regulator [Acidobacteriia bacterium]|nr:CopG family transcriptional regulator [Terriglobia bacterium]